MKHKMYVGYDIANLLNATLPKYEGGGDWRRLPDGTDILIGSEWVYASTDRVPTPCEVNLGEKEFVLWPPTYRQMNEIIEIAEGFNWAPEMPDAVEQLKRGVIPPGFARLVGSTIALFLSRPVIGWKYTGHKPAMSEEELRAVARRLARLRLLIAQVRSQTAGS